MVHRYVFLWQQERALWSEVMERFLHLHECQGPGGFIDISQSTRSPCFLTKFTTNGLEVSIPGDGTISIKQEGSVRKFVSEVIETTFSGDEAVRRGQAVYYVTERAVFRRTAKHDVLELTEIAPGIDLQKDILDQMDFEPVISSDLKSMDERIFKGEKVQARSMLFGTLEERCKYHEKSHAMFLNLFGITIESTEDIDWLIDGIIRILEPLVEKKGPLEMIVNYDGFDLRKGLEETYSAEVARVEKKYYKSAKRFAALAFHRAELGKKIRVSEWNPAALFDEFDQDKVLVGRQLLYWNSDSCGFLVGW